MPHGTLEVHVADDPDVVELATFLDVTAEIYDRIYLIKRADAVSPRELARRLRIPSLFIPSEDRLRLRSLKRGSFVFIFDGFTLALAGTSSILGLALLFARLLKILADRDKSKAEARKLDAEAKKLLAETKLLGDRRRRRRRRKPEASTVRKWIKFAMRARDSLRRVGIEIDVSEAEKYLETTDKDLKGTPRTLGMSAAEAQQVTDETIEPLTRLHAIQIVKIELK